TRFSRDWSSDVCSSDLLAERKVEGKIENIVPEVEHISNEEQPSVIKILTFNLGFLYGEGSEGPGYEFRDKEYYEDALLKLAEEKIGRASSRERGTISVG